MAGGRWIEAALPRLCAGRGRATAAGNAGGLVAVALVGAALVHVLAYHVAPAVSAGGSWPGTVAQSLLHCPLLGPLGLVAAIAILAPLLALGEVTRLSSLHRRLSKLADAADALPRGGDARPRSPLRLAAFFVALLGLQAAFFTLAGLVCPMRATMVMGGAPMTMPMAPALPLGLLHLVVGAILAVTLWRLERRLVRLREEIARLTRLLQICASRSRPRPRAEHTARVRYPEILFARPPPRAA